MQAEEVKAVVPAEEPVKVAAGVVVGREVTAGRFTIPTVEAEAMYDPEIYGIGSIERVIVTRD